MWRVRRRQLLDARIRVEVDTDTQTQPTKLKIWFKNPPNLILYMYVYTSHLAQIFGYFLSVFYAYARIRIKSVTLVQKVGGEKRKQI